MRTYQILAWFFIPFFILGCQGRFPIPFNIGVSYPDVAAYGEKVRFTQDHPIRFPDFTVTYLGERHVPSDLFPRGFIYHDFQVSHGAEAMIVSWSSGTGLIDPSFFEVAGKSYRLELRYSDALGKLAENEVVIGSE